ncbi:hypothetical protein FP2506_17879 [Fulvimarina pelagi HTCC2506]|uniref:Uncharacterized protein n=1 Tax=Fulvimarina pelagi HTCC2506 TaxID=314231 RepID=Q0G157_9HYPH|nr:hypothetical protein FP2506_17879 [Fulvimarina pelagi HTCC2506]
MAFADFGTIRGRGTIGVGSLYALSDETTEVTAARP